VLPPSVDEEEEEFVPPPPPPPAFVAAPLRKVEKPAPAPVQIWEEEQVEKDILEAALDDWGVDKVCGVDDHTLATIEAKEMGRPIPVRVTKKSRSPKKVEKKATVVVTREATRARKAEKQYTDIRVLALADDEGKDFLEKTLDSWGIDRLCGVDDVALGYADAYPEVPPPRPVPFENPTRLEYKEIPALEIVHSESLKEQRSKEIRVQERLPKKVYQRAPTNFDFVDPFGVDHDDFAMCGRLADICEPDFDVLQQPVAYTITAAPTPVALPEPERSILKKEAPKEDAPLDSVKNVSFQLQESPEFVVSLRGVEPDGAKNSFEGSQADNEPRYTKMTHGHLRSTPVPSVEQRPVSIVENVRSSRLRSKPLPEVTIVEVEQEVYQRQQRILQRNKAMLDAVDSHLWCG
jgi:hypothetical protein